MFISSQTCSLSFCHLTPSLLSKKEIWGKNGLANSQTLYWEERGTRSKSCRRKHCELIYLSKVAKSLEAEEQAGYHQRTAPDTFVPLPAFPSALRAQSPINAQVTMHIFVLMITRIPLSQHEEKTWRKDISIFKVVLFLSRTEVLNTQEATACVQKKPMFWECFLVFCYPNTPLG